MSGRFQVIFVLAILQACFALVAGAGAIVAAIIGLPAAPSGILSLAIGAGLLLLAAGQVRGWRRGLRAAIVFELLCAGAGGLDLLIRPDLLATLTNVGLPLGIAILLLQREASRHLTS